MIPRGNTRAPNKVSIVISVGILIARADCRHLGWWRSDSVYERLISL